MKRTNKKSKGSISSYLVGIGSISAIFSGFYNSEINKNSSKNDSISIRSDWSAIGGDFRKSLKKVKVEV